jgi:hypothetical protein
MNNFSPFPKILLNQTNHIIKFKGKMKKAGEVQQFCFQKEPAP